MRRSIGLALVGLATVAWLLWPVPSTRPVPQPVAGMTLEPLLPGLARGWEEAETVQATWLLADGPPRGGERPRHLHGELPTEVPLGSLRKWTTAALVVSLVDEGRLDLDAPVSTWLPAWSERPGVTLRRLLSHTSGLPMRPPAGTCKDLGTLDACVDAIAAVPLAFEPGERFGYSTTGFHVAARVAEVAGGAPFEELFREGVEEPLGLTTARFEAAGPGLPEMTGTLYLSPDDLLRFVRGVATGEGADGRWLSDASVALLHDGHTSGVPKVGTIPRGEWWTEGEDYYGLGVWRAGLPVDGVPRFVFSEGKQALVAGYDRVLDRAFVVGVVYLPGTGIAGRLLPHEVIHDLCVAGERVVGTGADDAEVRCLPFVATEEAQRTYRRCRAGRGDHRICLTAAQRVDAATGAP